MLLQPKGQQHVFRMPVNLSNLRIVILKDKGNDNIQSPDISPGSLQTVCRQFIYIYKKFLHIFVILIYSSAQADTGEHQRPQRLHNLYKFISF